MTSPSMVRYHRAAWKHMRVHVRHDGLTDNQFKQLRDRLSEAQNHRCAYCGADTRNCATLEHIQQQRDGGKTSFINCVIACAPCNNERMDRDPLAWFRLIQSRSGKSAIAIVRTSIAFKSDAELIAEFIAKNGVTKIGLSPLPKCQPKIRKCDWAKGKKFKPRHRYNLAVAYAKHHGLGEPAWTDVKEAKLLHLRSKGLSYSQCAEVMEKTKAAIQARVRYLALGRRLSVQQAA